MSASGSAAMESSFMRSRSAAMSPSCRYCSTADETPEFTSVSGGFMGESYSDPGGGRGTPERQSPMMVAEPSTLFARELIAQLLPGADPDKLVLALLAERDALAPGATAPDRYNSDEQVALRELRRVRSHLALGESARALQHAF